MAPRSPSPLRALEARLRWLLPADLYAMAWVDPSPPMLTRVFEHLRTLQRNLHDYLPRLVTDDVDAPGRPRHAWQEGTLMFTDLAGFTPLLEANATLGPAGAAALLRLLNSYFAAMLEIISKSGGNLLEFTGDAMLILFPADTRRSDTARAVRAALRMQRAMVHFADIETVRGSLALGMRIGIHSGRFLTATIGTPRRMEYVLLGQAVQQTKIAEGAGEVGRACLTMAAYQAVCGGFRFRAGAAEHVLVVDDFDDDQLGEYDITSFRRRPMNMMLVDRSAAGLLDTIEEAANLTEPLACYLPMPILTLLVENVARRKIRPEFPTLTVIFVNLIGLSQAADQVTPDEEGPLVRACSRTFALINAAVESRGGVLKNVTYERTGSDILIYFGAPNAHADDQLRAADAALAIRDIVAQMPPLVVRGEQIRLTCQIGVALGPAFAAEIGEPRGRREFNILGDTVNTAARLMSRAEARQILITEDVYRALGEQYVCEAYGMIALKGKAGPIALFALSGQLPAMQ